MHPQLDLAGWRVPSYVLTAAVGMIVGVVLARERARRDGLSDGRLTWVGAAACLAGLVGARAWSVGFEAWPGSEGDAWDLATQGGLSIIGGLLGGAAGFVLVARSVGLPVLRAADASSPGAAVGIAFGRLGCLLAGCCYGRPTLFPVALIFDEYDAGARPMGVPLHATQVYEMAGLLMLAAVLWRVRLSRHGMRFAVLLIGYGAIRSCIEPLRADWRGDVMGLPATQVAAAGLMLIGVALALVLRVRSPSSSPSSAAREVAPVDVG